MISTAKDTSLIASLFSLSVVFIADKVIRQRLNLAENRAHALRLFLYAIMLCAAATTVAIAMNWIDIPS
jgi:hypothetical protein